jgi:hypothetical protein
VTTTNTPASALLVGEWRLNHGTARGFEGTRRGTAVACGRDINVDIDGYQYRDGRVHRYISVNGHSFLSVAEARGVAANLLAAADELDRLNK